MTERPWADYRPAIGILRQRRDALQRANLELEEEIRDLEDKAKRLRDEVRTNQNRIDSAQEAMSFLLAGAGVSQPTI